jgi:hypothetical protein
MKIILLFLVFSLPAFSQGLSNGAAEKFINLLLKDSQPLTNFVLPEELDISNRFRIEYEGVKNKFLIANEIPYTLKKELLSKKIEYDYKTTKLDDDYSSLSIDIDSENIHQKFFFKDSLIVSPAYYYSRNWQKIETDYFEFYVSDKSSFNKYSILQLENFVKRMTEILQYSESEIELLRAKKIYYFLCKDEGEINKLTGFTIRGIYNLAYDYIITTYNTHYHELLHFLINNKLKKLPLYTHPFLQEGFAVAYGGRGGLEPHTILEMGTFLINSDFFDYKELLGKTDFLKTDASISYPVSGLYTVFLIKQFGIKNFLNLYLKYSGNSEQVFLARIKTEDIPQDDKWNLFVDSLHNQNPIKIIDNTNLDNLKLLAKSKDFEIYENKESYFFRVKDTLLINSTEKIDGYKSKLFTENFTDRKYNSEKYLITVNQNEVSVYNLYSNNLIGKYVASFALPPKNVNEQNKFYEFLVNKNLFDETISKECF